MSRVSDSSRGLPRLSLLRTVLATFTAYGSSTLKVTEVTRQYTSGCFSRGKSSTEVPIPICTIWVSFSIDEDMSFDDCVRGIF